MHDKSFYYSAAAEGTCIVCTVRRWAPTLFRTSGLLANAKFSLSSDWASAFTSAGENLGPSHEFGNLEFVHTVHEKAPRALTRRYLPLDNPCMVQSKKRPPSSPKNDGSTPAEPAAPSPEGAASAESTRAGKAGVAKPKNRKKVAPEVETEAPRRRGRPRRQDELRQTEARPDELKRAISLLDELVQMFGGSRRHVDKMLGTGRSRTSQLLSGRLELKFQHILDVLDVLGIESRAFFEVLYGEEEHAPFPAPLAVVYRQKLRAMGVPAALESIAPKLPEPPAIPRFLTEEEVRQLIDHRLFEAFSQVMPKKPAKGDAPGDPPSSE
jgi:hypothetical protein